MAKQKERLRKEFQLRDLATAEESAADRQAIVGMMQPTNMQTPSAPQVDDTGEPSAASLPAMAPADTRGAEARGMASQFPESQALGKALFEARKKQEEQRNAELLKRVALRDIQGGNLERGLPKETFGVSEGVPHAISEEGVRRVGPGYAQTTVPGAEGKPMAAQVAPFTGKIDVLDKTPRVTTNVNTTEDPNAAYKKALLGGLGKSDFEAVEQSRKSIDDLHSIEQMKKLHVNTKGEWTGGPVAGLVKYGRGLASQAGMPLDPKLDENNAGMQAIMMRQIAQAIFANGRGLSNDDRAALEKSFPLDNLTPAVFPAFITQYEELVRRNATKGEAILAHVERNNPELGPSLRRTTIPPSGPVRAGPTGGLGGYTKDQIRDPNFDINKAIKDAEAEYTRLFGKKP